MVSSTRKSMPKARRRMTLKKIRSLSDLKTWCQQNPRTTAALLGTGTLVANKNRIYDFALPINKKEDNKCIENVWHTLFHNQPRFRDELKRFKNDRNDFNPLYKKLLSFLKTRDPSDAIFCDEDTPSVDAPWARLCDSESVFKKELLRIKNHKSARNELHEYVKNGQVPPGLSHLPWKTGIGTGRRTYTWTTGNVTYDITVGITL